MGYDQVELSKADALIAADILSRDKAYEADKIRDTLKHGATRVFLDLWDWEYKDIEALGERIEHRHVQAFCRAVAKIKLRPRTARVGTLRMLPAAISGFLFSECIDGWLYKSTNGRHVACVVTDVHYSSGSYRREEPLVILTMRANGISNDDVKPHDIHVTFRTHDIVGRSAEEILLEHGLLHETPELRAAYDRDVELFLKYMPMHHIQFIGRGTVSPLREDVWDRRHEYALDPQGSKLVNEEAISNRTLAVTCSNENWTARINEKAGLPKTLFTSVPIHPYLLMFDLARHQLCWAHAADLEVYQYDTEMHNKLVLPPKHRELINVLTTDIEVFQDDIVKGKSGGTAILCYGPPGLGKTLSVEVYAEKIQKPLYRVHAGQLGTDLHQVESVLTDILKRAERWGAVLLIDEADVYIRRRDNDMEHNAVVAAFLRTLEYFHGLLFMTTNRQDDVDDAIISRMVAMFRYDPPDADMRGQLWRILAKEIGVAVSDRAVETLVSEFPEASGRDIKQLLKLTAKYCRYKNQKLSIAAFKVCAMFRGIRISENNGGA